LSYAHEEKKKFYSGKGLVFMGTFYSVNRLHDTKQASGIYQAVQVCGRDMWLIHVAISSVACGPWLTCGSGCWPNGSNMCASRWRLAWMCILMSQHVGCVRHLGLSRICRGFDMELSCMSGQQSRCVRCVPHRHRNTMMAASSASIAANLSASRQRCRCITAAVSHF
jgi:hypothetical protein